MQCDTDGRNILPIGVVITDLAAVAAAAKSA